MHANSIPVNFYSNDTFAFVKNMYMKKSTQKSPAFSPISTEN